MSWIRGWSIVVSNLTPCCLFVEHNNFSYVWIFFPLMLLVFFFRPTNDRGTIQVTLGTMTGSKPAIHHLSGLCQCTTWIPGTLLTSLIWFRRSFLQTLWVLGSKVLIIPTRTVEYVRSLFLDSNASNSIDRIYINSTLIHTRTGFRSGIIWFGNL